MFTFMGCEFGFMVNSVVRRLALNWSISALGILPPFPARRIRAQEGSLHCAATPGRHKTHDTSQLEPVKQYHNSLTLFQRVMCPLLCTVIVVPAKAQALNASDVPIRI